MEVKKINEDGKRWILEFEDESIAFAHAVSEKLWDDSSIKEAAVIREHPYLSKPKLLVETSRGSPKSAIEKATEKLMEEAREFREKFKDASKK